MEGLIYSLIDPQDNIVKYIGKTTFSLEKRYNEHIRNSNYKKTKDVPVYKWINLLKENNLTPIIKLIEGVDKLIINEREKFWIEYYKSSDLTNVLKGGNTYGFINKREFTDKHRKGIGDSCRGEKHYNFNKPAHNIKPIYMFNKITGENLNEFKSIKDGSLFVNISITSISNCLTNKRNCGGEYIWIYKEVYDSDNQILKEKIIKCITNPSNKSSSITIQKINILTNEIIKIYPSYNDAARRNNTSKSALLFVCRKSKTNIYRGFKWKEIK